LGAPPARAECSAFASRARGPLRGLGAAPSLRERLRAFGAQRVGRAGFAGHGLRRGESWLVLRAGGASRSALAASGVGRGDASLD